MAIPLLLRRLLYGLGGLVAILVIAFLSLPLWLPTGAVERAIATAVRNGIGRDLVIQGELHAGLFPIRLEATDAALVRRADGTAPPLITAKTLTALLSLPRLLRGIVTITDLRLDDPVFLLAIDGEGRPNWTEQPDAKPPAGPASAEEARQRAQSNTGFSLSDIRITNGVFQVRDDRSRTAFQVDALTLKASLPGLDKPLTADGTFTWRDKPVHLSESLANPSQLGGGGTSAAHLELTADAGRVVFDGTVQGQGEVVALGDLKIDVPSVEKLVAWTGTSLSFPGPGVLAIAGKATLSQEKIELADATLSLDQIKGTGSLNSALGGQRPSLGGALNFDALDLTPYVGGAALAKSTEAGWSSTPFVPTALPPLDLRIALTAAGVTLPGLTLGRTAVTVAIDGDRLVLDRLTLPLAGGRVSGRIALTEGRTEGAGAPQWEAALLLQQLQIEKLVAAGGGGSSVTGVGSADLRLTGRGRSAREIATSLAGTMRLATVRTEIKGIHLPSLVGNVPGAVIAAASGRDVPPGRATIEANLKLAGGVGRTDDLDIKSQAVRLTGAGTIDVGRRQLDLLLTPRVISPSAVSLVGIRLSGFMVPILVQGPWNAPRWAPQPDKAVKQHLGDPLQAVTDALPDKPGPAAAKDSDGFDPIGWLDRLFTADPAK